VGVDPYTGVSSDQYLGAVQGYAKQIGMGSGGTAQPINGMWGGNPTGQGIVSIAEQYLGTPYVWGGIPGKGDTPTGWDCSGFTYWLDQNYGTGQLVQGSHYQYQQAQQSGKLFTNMDQLQPGDLIFFDTGWQGGAGAELNHAGHVAMYIGNGQIIHAANPDSGTIISPLSGYYTNAFLGAEHMSWSGGGGRDARWQPGRPTEHRQLRQPDHELPARALMSYRDLLLRARLLANEGGPPTQPPVTSPVPAMQQAAYNALYNAAFNANWVRTHPQPVAQPAPPPTPQAVAQAIGAVQPSGLYANQPDPRNPQQVVQALAAEQAARAAQQQPAQPQPVQPVAQDQVYPAAAYQAPPDQSARALFPAGTPPAATQGQVNESPLTTLDTGAGALFNKGMELLQRVPSVPVTLPNIMATPGHPGATNDQGGTTVHVGPKEVIGLYNKGFMANIGRTGQDMIDVANGGNAPGLNNPYYYVDAGVEDYANDPANKAKIAAVSTNGLDLNGDGTPDVMGGKAVYLMYLMEHHGGFVDSMMTTMAQDPLFAMSFVVPMAGALREGTAEWTDMAHLVGDRGAVLNAVDRAVAKAHTGLGTVQDLAHIADTWRRHRSPCRPR
jgi:hypothetical protein